jgi:hypothetical protein
LLPKPSLEFSARATAGRVDIAGIVAATPRPSDREVAERILGWDTQSRIRRL